MAIYVDDMYALYGRMRMCHMVADTLAELHAMADAIGMKRGWFQERSSFWHYDVSLEKRRRAVKLGARELTARELMVKIEELKAPGGEWRRWFESLREVNDEIG